ncbi:hypothetical protein [Rubripirellula reticaptiva]|uniref:Uncharacterized protein n=1 Tax=Rubripirellula reticaptiva TaxID=2528013 RepID=A0A5C6F7R1_9BACT|nr:hypothetical protein [Rubripirellula reticaptiva]TWU55799.1 hypothetical protein Poly59_21010 [Rubripirellula reticaptiva]
MNHLQFKKTLPRHRRGASLIDVAIGSMLLSLLLIPSVRWIGQSQTINQRVEDRDAMLFEAEQLIETLTVKMSEPSAFDDAFNRPMDSVTKVQTPGGKIYLARYQVGPDKTLPSSKLLTLTVTVWRDTDSDGNLDTNEVTETLQTQVAAP